MDDRADHSAESLRANAEPGSLDTESTSPDAEPASPDVEPASPDVEPTSPDMEPTSPDMEPASSDMEPALPDVESASPESGIGSSSRFSTPPDLRARESDLWTLLRISGPIMVATVSQTVMRFVDFAMVSQLGTDAQAAVGASGVTLFVLIGFWIGVMSCINTFSSQALGRNRPEECGGYVWQAIYISLVAGVVAIPLWPFVPHLFRFFDHGENVVPLEIVYMQVGLFNVGPFAIEVALSNFFNGVHRPRVTMITAIGANIFNAGANYILIFGRPELGIPAMGVKGAALGTVLAMCFRSVWLMIVLLMPYYAERFATRRAWRFDRAKATSLLRIGLPAGLQFTFEILAWSVFMMWLVGQFGPKHLAATNIVWQYLHLSFMPALGIGIGLTAVVGKALGENRRDLARRRARIALVCCGSWMAGCGLMFFVLRGFLVGLWAQDDAVLAIGKQLMICGAIFQVFDAMCLVYNSALKGAGDTVWTMVAMVVTCWVVLIGGGYGLTRMAPGLGALGPWIAVTAYVTVLGLILAARWRRGGWEKINIFKSEDQSAGSAETGQPAVPTTSAPDLAIEEPTISRVGEVDHGQ